MAGTEFPFHAGRREALKKIAVGASAATVFPILGQAGAHAATAPMSHEGMQMTGSAPQPDPNWKPLFFDSHQNETLIVLTDLIIPATDTPGAKEALVNRVIDLFINDEDPGAQRQFLEGLAWIDGRSLELHGKPFIALSAPQQTALLEPLANPQNSDARDQAGVRFFEDVKDWTLFGYYTSQIGLEQELQYGGSQYHDSFPGACTHPEHQKS